MARISRALAVIAPLALALSACGSGATSSTGDETFTLQFASYNVATSPEAVASQEWADRISEATDGRVKIEFSFQEALLSAVDTLPGVADGRADMGFIAGAYYPAELPLSNVAGIPFVTSDPAAQGRAFQELYEDDEALRAEWEAQGVHVLTWAPFSANILALKDPIEKFSDLERRKVRGYGYVSEALDQAGVEPVGISQTEVYEALQRGVLDGTSGASMDIAVDRKFYEVAKQFVDVNFGNYAMTANIINLNKWNSLPQDVRDAIEEVSATYLDRYMELLAELEDQACERITAAGTEIMVIPESETAGWASSAGPKVRAVWEADAEKAGSADPAAFYEKYTALVQQHEAGSDYETPIQRCATR
jgi:TRAP-type C4-dicarboxylate transport system substrate-binding protein